ncbi:MAG: SPOR domain-containing protein [Prevotella sp.]|nr:SPOR domain-containing protein [Prevotella sp.]MCI2080283.1 SPOR domain-containing protein [Prevotella sp.]MCI2101642.1 SPOR domain-containing protein [Prevotella sp.]
MKPFVTFWIIILCTATSANAQTFMEYLRKNVQGQGTVSVTQSREIEALVNGKQPVSQNGKTEKGKTTASSQKVPSTAVLPQKETTHKTKNTTNDTKPTATEKEKKAVQEQHPLTTEQHKTETMQKNDSAKKAEANRTERPNRAESPQEEDDEMEIPTVDMRKKVMRRSYKVNGYRVQVFSGGNSRQDKIKAQKAGNNVKMAFPELPVYVHFYSPKWVCRVGNFKSYEEAHRVLQKVMKMGYRSATILRGKITVQD